MTTQLPKERLAAYEQEPYGYVHKAVYEMAGSCGLSSDHEAYRNSNGSHIPLYTHPAPSIPAPLPEEITDMKLKKAFLWIDDVIRHNPGMKEAVTCRVAMLQAEPVKQKVTLREGIQALRDLGGIDAEKILSEREALNDDGWIPVSERFPEDFEDVIATDGDDKNFAWWSSDDNRWVFPGDYVIGEITHWQPLPAPPKE